jgi:hypothetical protein
VQRELLGDLCLKGADLLGDCAQCRDPGEGDVTAGLAVRPGGSARGGGEAGVQELAGLLAAVTVGAQPRVQALRAEPVGGLLVREPGQEWQADRRVELGEQPDRAGEGQLQVRAQLVGQRDPVARPGPCGPGSSRAA